MNGAVFEGAGPGGAFWVLMEGADQGPCRETGAYQCRGSRCRAAAGPPQARRPGENRLGSASCPSPSASRKQAVGRAFTRVTSAPGRASPRSPLLLFLSFPWLWLDPSTHQAMLWGYCVHLKGI